MLKRYYTRPEHVNLTSFERNSKQMEDQNLDILYPENGPTIMILKK